MSMLTLLVFLTGAVLGMRFKVLILAPATLIVFAAVFASGMASGQSLTAVLPIALLAPVCLQLGYIGGVLTRHATTLARGAALAADLESIRLVDETRPLRPPGHHAGSTQTQYRG